MDVKTLAVLALLALWLLLFLGGIVMVFGKGWDFRPLLRSINALEGSRTRITKKTEISFYIQNKIMGIISIIVALYMIYFTTSFYFGKDDLLGLPTILNNMLFAFPNFVNDLNK